MAAYQFNVFTGRLDLVDGLASLLLSFTDGSVIFAESGTLQQDNANFFYDNTTNSLGIGTNTGFTSTEHLRVYPTIDSQMTVGNARIGYGNFPAFGIASFSHYLHDSLSDFAVAQLSDGTTFVNSAPGTNLSFGNPFAPTFVMTSSSATVPTGISFNLQTPLATNLQLLPASTTGISYTFTFPKDDGVTNNVLVNQDGASTTTWSFLNDNNIASGAGITVNKLAALTANRLVQTDSSGFISAGTSLSGGLVPYGVTAGGFTASSTSMLYDTTQKGLIINKNTTPRAALDATGSVITNFVINAQGAVSQSGDLYRAENSSSTQLWGITSAGLMKVASSGPTVGNGTGSIFGLSDARSGINWTGTAQLDLFTNASTNISLTTAGATLAKGVLDVPTGGGPSAGKYTFTGRLTDSMYSSAANEVAFATNSLLRGKWTNNGLTVSTGVVDVPATTSTTVPIYTFTGDLNTGFGVAAADDLVAIANGATVIRANGTGTMVGSSTAPVGSFNIFQNGVEAFWLTGTVNTTDATQTTLITFTTATDISYHIEADVIARRTGGTLGAAGDTAAYKVLGFAKNVAGTVTLSTLAVSLGAEDQVLMDATFTVSGTAVRVSVTGTVSNNFTWDGLWKIIRV